MKYFIQILYIVCKVKVKCLSYTLVLHFKLLDKYYHIYHQWCLQYLTIGILNIITLFHHLKCCNKFHIQAYTTHRENMIDMVLNSYSWLTIVIGHNVMT